MYVKKVGKNTYRKDWLKELEDKLFYVLVGAAVYSVIHLAVLIIKSF